MADVNNDAARATAVQAAVVAGKTADQSGTAATATTGATELEATAATSTEARPAGEVASAEASDIEASGAVLEPGATASIPMDHPAVESNPRKGLPPESSQIDFNDPSFRA